MSEAVQAFKDSLNDIAKTNLAHEGWTLIDTNQVELLSHAWDEPDINEIVGQFVGYEGKGYTAFYLDGTNNPHDERYTTFLAAIIDASHPEADIGILHMLDGSGYEADIVSGVLTIDEAAELIDKGISFEKYDQQRSLAQNLAMERIDSKGNILLEIDEHDGRIDALLFRPIDTLTPYIIAHNYSFSQGDWSYGSYYKTLDEAVAEFVPNMLETPLQANESIKDIPNPALESVTNSYIEHARS